MDSPILSACVQSFCRGHFRLPKIDVRLFKGLLAVWPGGGGGGGGGGAIALPQGRQNAVRMLKYRPKLTMYFIN